MNGRRSAGGSESFAKEGIMRTTRDAIAKDWLPCPEANQDIDLRLSFLDCKGLHECEDRLPSH